MLTDENISLFHIKSKHSNKSSIVRQLIIRLSKSKTTLFGLLLKLLESFENKSNFSVKYSKNLENGPSKCFQ